MRISHLGYRAVKGGSLCLGLFTDVCCRAGVMSVSVSVVRSRAGMKSIEVVELEMFNRGLTANTGYNRVIYLLLIIIRVIRVIRRK